jgi:hypothetical protein
MSEMSMAMPTETIMKIILWLVIIAGIGVALYFIFKTGGLFKT